MIDDESAREVATGFRDESGLREAPVGSTFRAVVRYAISDGEFVTVDRVSFPGAAGREALVGLTHVDGANGIVLVEGAADEGGSFVSCVFVDATSDLRFIGLDDLPLAMKRYALEDDPELHVLLNRIARGHAALPYPHGPALWLLEAAAELIAPSLDDPEGARDTSIEQSFAVSVKDSAEAIGLGEWRDEPTFGSVATWLRDLAGVRWADLAPAPIQATTATSDDEARWWGAAGMGCRLQLATPDLDESLGRIEDVRPESAEALRGLIDPLWEELAPTMDGRTPTDGRQEWVYDKPESLVAFIELLRERHLATSPDGTALIRWRRGRRGQVMLAGEIEEFAYPHWTMLVGREPEGADGVILLSWHTGADDPWIAWLANREGETGMHLSWEAEFAPVSHAIADPMLRLALVRVAGGPDAALPEPQPSVGEWLRRRAAWTIVRGLPVGVRLPDAELDEVMMTGVVLAPCIAELLKLAPDRPPVLELVGEDPEPELDPGLLTERADEVADWLRGIFDTLDDTDWSTVPATLLSQEDGFQPETVTWFGHNLIGGVIGGGIPSTTESLKRLATFLAGNAPRTEAVTRAIFGSSQDILWSLTGFPVPVQLRVV